MDIGDKLRAISEPTRYAIVQLLLERDHCSRSLSLALGISESAVSQHMAVLKESGLVHGIRCGYRVHYILDRDEFSALITELEDWLDRMDRAESCCSGNLCRFHGQDACCNSTRRTGCRKMEERKI